jgi:hypothetical protein
MLWRVTNGLSTAGSTIGLAGPCTHGRAEEATKDEPVRIGFALAEQEQAVKVLHVKIAFSSIC